MNIERPIPLPAGNIECKAKLEKRLLTYSVRIIKIIEKPPNTDLVKAPGLLDIFLDKRRPSLPKCWVQRFKVQRFKG